ncbi:hypothetical protein GCM10022237_46020 [Nocardioides ginsengisoli]
MAVVAVLALAGCKGEASIGAKTIRASELETKFAAAVAAQKKVDPDTVEVSCPDDLPARKGAKVGCTVTDARTVYDATATYTGAEKGDNVHFEWDPKAMRGTVVAEQIKGQAATKGLTVTTIACDGDLEVTPGSTLACTMTDDGGRTWAVTATSKGPSADGVLDYTWDATADASSGSPAPTSSPSAGEGGAGGGAGSGAGSGGAAAHGSRYPDGHGDVTALSLADYLGQTLSSLSGKALRATCPGPLRGAAGSTVTCSMSARTGGGGSFPVKVTSEGPRADGQIGFAVEILH